MSTNFILLIAALQLALFETGIYGAYYDDHEGKTRLTEEGTRGILYRRHDHMIDSGSETSHRLLETWSSRERRGYRIVDDDRYEQSFFERVIGQNPSKRRKSTK